MKIEMSDNGFLIAGVGGILRYLNPIHAQDIDLAVAQEIPVDVVQYLFPGGLVYGDIIVHKDIFDDLFEIEDLIIMLKKMP